MLNNKTHIYRVFLVSFLGLILSLGSPALAHAQSRASFTPTANTENATNIEAESADLNSLITNSQNNPSNIDTWFEWGLTPALGNKTETVSVKTLAAFRHTDTITELKPETIYYFRVVAENAYYRSNGTILNFVTKHKLFGAPTQNTNTDGSNLGANAIGAGDFWPHTLLGWLTMIILVLILALLGRHVYRKSHTAQHHPEHHEHA